MKLSYTPDELSLLHTILEGHAEVRADDGDDAEAARLLDMVCDDPDIGADDAEWIITDAQDFDDEPGQDGLRDKMAQIIEAAR